jgi:hypothetical protein
MMMRTDRVTKRRDQVRGVWLWLEKGSLGCPEGETLTGSLTAPSHVLGRAYVGVRRFFFSVLLFCPAPVCWDGPEES